MKKISKLLLCLGLFLSLSLAGCATASKSNKQNKVEPSVSLTELECRKSCKFMAVCSGRPFSEHDLLICGRECLTAHPAIRAAVTECSLRWLKDCNKQKMNSCVQRKLSPSRQQQ